jgi:hypothetical protein
VFFTPIGPGGNGRASKRGEYVPNGSTLRLFGLYDKPGAKPAKK